MAPYERLLFVLLARIAEDHTTASALKLLTRRQLFGGGAALCSSAGLAQPACAEDLMDVCPNCKQPIDVLPLKSVRGRWDLDAAWKEESGQERRLKGEIQFRGLGAPNKGRCSFASEDGTLRGTGSWSEKPARISKGQFSWSARWKLRLSDGTTVLFRGDTSTGSPDDFLEMRRPPTIEAGDVLREAEGPLDGMVTQRRVGTFRATCRQSWDGDESDDSKIAGGRAMELRPR